nr:glycosyltransferase family 1 protein [Desulfobacterales bacterium]
MKVALVRNRYTEFGGAERYLDTLIRRLHALGHEVHIFANEWKDVKDVSGSCLGGGTQRSGLCFHRVPMIKGLSILKVISFALNAKRLLKRERFDIIHSFERTLFQDIYRAGDGCHREWLVQRRRFEPWWKTGLVRINPLHLMFLWIEKRLFQPKNTKVIIANSRRGRSEIIRHYRFPQDRIQVIYNGVDFNRFHPSNRQRYRVPVRRELSISESDSIILFMGSGFERKGLRFAIQAVARLRDPKLKLVVVGRDRFTRYERLSSKLGVEDSVFFVGSTTQPEKWYGAADLFLLPTVYDPFSNACLEALASGIPVVTTRMNGVSEWIEEGVTGISLNDPADIAGMAYAIKAMLRTRDTGMFFRRKEKMDCLSFENHVEKTLDIYRKIIKKEHGN